MTAVVTCTSSMPEVRNVNVGTYLYLDVIIC